METMITVPVLSGDGCRDNASVHPGASARPRSTARRMARCARRRVVEVGTGNADIPAYKSISIVDVVFQPGAHAPQTVMDNDMVCTITSGAFTIKKVDKEFKLKTGDMYTCSKGKTDEATNTSKEVGVHRIAILIPA